MIFVSHREAEREVAEHLVEFILAALDIKNDDLRCTSVEGFQLPFGFSIAEKLKADLNRADVVFAIITPMSLKSQWVLFELGASWALGKLVVPVLAPGLKPSDLPGPLAQYPAVNVSNNDAAARMYDSISQVATLLQLEEKRGGRPAAKLSKFLEDFRTWRAATEPGVLEARAFQLARLLIVYRFKLTEHAASIAVQMERHAAALEVDLPTDWRRTLETTDDGALVNEMMRFVGGQLQVLRPRVLKFYERDGIRCLPFSRMTRMNSIRFSTALASLARPQVADQYLSGSIVSTSIFLR